MNNRLFTFSGLIILLVSIAFIAGCASPELRTARIATKERDWERVLKSADNEIARLPNNAEAYYLKGLAYENLRKWEEMSAAYDKAVELSPLFTPRVEASRDRILRDYLLRSARYTELSDSAANDTKLSVAYNDSALATLDTAMIIDPQNGAIRREAALIAYYAEKHQLAENYALGAVELEDQSKPELLTRELLLLLYRNKKDNEAILRWAQEIMKLIDPKTDTTDTYLTALDAMVNTYLETSQGDKAEELVRSAIAALPNRVDLKIALADLLIEREDLQAVEQVYSEVLELEPDNFVANLNIGTIYIDQKKWEKAIPHLEKAREIDPLNKSALINLMSAYGHLENYGKFDELKKLYDQLP